MLTKKEEFDCVIKFKRIDSAAMIPKYEHSEDSGADVCAIFDHRLQPFERKEIPTGLIIEVPKGLELQIRPKSGLASKEGITVLNTPGTIDSGYRGEIKVILINLGSEAYNIKKGDKIAQVVVVPVMHANFQESDKLAPSSRGSKGIGSTGKSRVE